MLQVLRIWDTHLQVCLQRLSGMFPKGPAEGFSFSLSEFIYVIIYLLLLSKEDKFKAPKEEKA